MARKGYTRLPDGTYKIKFSHDGKRVEKRTKFTREADVKAEVGRMRAELLIGVKSAGPSKSAAGGLTIRDAFSRYFHETGQHGGDAKTISSALARIEKFFNNGTMLIGSISHSDVLALVADRRTHYRQDKPRLGIVSNATVNRTTWQIMKRVMNVARDEWGVEIKAMPLWKKFAERLPERKDRPRILAQREQDALVRAMAGDHDYIPVFLTLLLTGMRLREVVLLEWRQVDLNSLTITKVGKGGAPIHKPISPRVAAIIRSRVGLSEGKQVFTYEAERTGAERRHAPTATQPNGWLMLPATIKGRRYPMTINGYDSWWGRVRDIAAKECPSLTADRATSATIHTLRHTFATRLLQATGNLALVKEELAHSNISVTMKYAHVLDGDRRAAVNAAEDFIAGSPTAIMPALPAPEQKSA